MFNNFRLKRVTYNLGNPVETDLDITCAVDNDKLTNRLLKNNNHLMLKSKNDPKAITYVISDMIFAPNFRLTTDDSVVFINCTFNNEVYIDSADKISFTNNEYIIFNDNYVYNDRFMVINNTDSVSFINDNFVNSAEFPYKYDMKINANNILIQDSNIFEDNVGHLFFDCKNLKVKKNSNISLRTGRIKADKLLIDAYSKIDVKNRIVIDTNHAIGLSNINCNDKIVNCVRVHNIDSIEIQKNPKTKIKKSNR